VSLIARLKLPRLIWIGVRPARDQAMIAADVAEVRLGRGLVGDRYAKNAAKAGPNSGKREVTLISAQAVATLAGRLGLPKQAGFSALYPQTRRNLVIDGMDLSLLIGERFFLGDVEFLGTGDCAPCARMNLAFGAGGFAAMHTLGGLTARVIRPGLLKLGDAIGRL
jgi:MOSC domain-containing protein YiiM